MVAGSVGRARRSTRPGTSPCAHCRDARLAPFGVPVPDGQLALTAIKHLLETFADTAGVGASRVDFFAVDGVADPADRRDVVLLGAVRAALTKLAGPDFQAAFGGSTDQGDYRWGRLHRVTLDHPLGGPFNTLLVNVLGKMPKDLFLEQRGNPASASRFYRLAAVGEVQTVAVSAEAITGHRIVKAFGAEAREAEKFQAASAKLHRTNMSVTRLVSILPPTMELLGAFAPELVALSPRTAGLMLTNPSTLGLFDEGIEETAEFLRAEYARWGKVIREANIETE